MSKLIVSEFVSLNGVMEAPGVEPTHPHTGWTFESIYGELLIYEPAASRGSRRPRAARVGSAPP